MTTGNNNSNNNNPNAEALAMIESGISSFEGFGGIEEVDKEFWWMFQDSVLEGDSGTDGMSIRFFIYHSLREILQGLSKLERIPGNVLTISYQPSNPSQS